MRIGFGYDVHRLISGRRLIIGGVDIPFAQGLQGHSDADVLSHAIGDALLGAAALGDLGAHFPPDDAQYRGISSLVLLKKINGLLKRSSLVIQNIDATVVAQKPKMMPFINEMRKNIARSLTLEIDQISIKATTTEGLGFAGEGAGIAAYAVCLIL
ncbi:MAG TPA: 2-C-methyl-D-erythritol 2,4-cyclodiphosphate synthase [bacterium]|nr:2-C-methyl-D-erythritol 2,4-cyclodiphosphate synthase [bacterium]